MFKGIQHTGFITKNIDKLYEFYTKIPGVKVVFDMHIEDGKVAKKVTGYKNAKLKNFYIQIGEDKIQPQNKLGVARIEFIEYLKPVGKQLDIEENNAGGNAHISIITDSIEDDYKSLKNKRMKFYSKPVEIEYEEGGLKGVKVVYFKDPDNRTVELIQFTKLEK